MEVREIKALVTLMHEFGLVELEIEDKKGKVRLVRGNLGADGVEPGRVPPVPAAPAPRVAKKSRGAAQPAPTNGPTGSAPVELGPGQQLVESPMVGTFYRAASPDAAPFVEEGSSVRKGQALCIIEAMKMMNEIEAPAAGRIVRILCDNGQPVQYGQPLMVIEAA